MPQSPYRTKAPGNHIASAAATGSEVFRQIPPFLNFHFLSKALGASDPVRAHRFCTFFPADMPPLLPLSLLPTRRQARQPAAPSPPTCKKYIKQDPSPSLSLPAAPPARFSALHLPAAVTDLRDQKAIKQLFSAPLLKRRDSASGDPVRFHPVRQAARQRLRLKKGPAF